jgi:hypothetical protein
MRARLVDLEGRVGFLDEGVVGNEEEAVSRPIALIKAPRAMV